MSDIKMSKVFPVGVQVTGVPFCSDMCELWLDESNPLSDSKGWMSKDKAEALAHAINSHDNLVFDLDHALIYGSHVEDVNKDLAKQVSELRSALVDIKRHQELTMANGTGTPSIWTIADKALKKGEL